MYQLFFTTRYINTTASCPYIKRAEIFDTESEARSALNGYLKAYKNREDWTEPRYTLFKLVKIDGN